MVHSYTGSVGFTSILGGGIPLTFHQHLKVFFPSTGWLVVMNFDLHLPERDRFSKQFAGATPPENIRWKAKHHELEKGTII